MVRIQIQSGKLRLQAELGDCDCAKKILAALPISTNVSTWGDEVYFSIGLSVRPSDTAREEMDIGEIGYWPPGKALCLFFGPTPVSDTDGKPRAASPVVPVGRILESPHRLKSIRDGDDITISAVT